MEQVNGQRVLPSSQGKYDVSRMLEAPPVKVTPTLPKQLPAAA